MLTVLGLTFLATVLVGVPIAFSLGLAAAATLVAWGQVPLWLLAQRMFTGVDSFVFMAIPFFILAGELMTTAGILDRLVKFADGLVGHIRGGLAHVTIVAEMFFSGISGSAVADAAALSAVLSPSMSKQYDPDFGNGVVASAAMLGPIIPPSIPMVVYALAAGGVSIAGLFIAGIIPGIVLAAGMMASCVIAEGAGFRCGAHHDLARVSAGDVDRSGAAHAEIIWRVWRHLHRHRGGAVAVAYAAGGPLCDHELKWRTCRPPWCARSPSVVFMLIACSNAVSWLLTTQQVPSLVAQFLKAYASSPWIFLLIINIFLLIVGCLMDLSAAMIMLVPILAPIALTYGVDPLHFGFIVTLNLTIGLLTPPVGAILFVVCGISKTRWSVWSARFRCCLASQRWRDLRALVRVWPPRFLGTDSSVATTPSDPKEVRH
jgi:C4-dicarboxylate transporter DctM subunit